MEELLSSDVILQVVSMVITVLGGVATYYLKQLVDTKVVQSTIDQYNIDNEVVERVMANAIEYAEAKAKVYAKDAINKDVTKQDIAIHYIEEVKPAMAIQYEDELKTMLERKVAQIIK